jgi:hypothetical protein
MFYVTYPFKRGVSIENVLSKSAENLDIYKYKSEKSFRGSKYYNAAQFGGPLVINQGEEVRLVYLKSALDKSMQQCGFDKNAHPRGLSYFQSGFRQHLIAYSFHECKNKIYAKFCENVSSDVAFICISMNSNEHVIRFNAKHEFEIPLCNFNILNFGLLSEVHSGKYDIGLPFQHDMVLWKYGVEGDVELDSGKKVNGRQAFPECYELGMGMVIGSVYNLVDISRIIDDCRLCGADLGLEHDLHKPHEGEDNANGKCLS